MTHTQVGRRSRYDVHPDRPFRHPAQDGHLVGPLLELLANYPPDGAKTTPAESTRSTAIAESGGR